MRMMYSERVCTDEKGATRVIWTKHGGFTIETDLKKGGTQSIPIDPQAMDAIVAAWPAFREKARSDAPAMPAAQVTPSPTASKGGPTATNSRSSPPPPPPPPAGRLL